MAFNYTSHSQIGKPEHAEPSCGSLSASHDLTAKNVKEMKAIERYRMNVQGLQYLSMPEKARILAVQIDRGKPYIVAEVDLDAEKQNFLIRTYLTGEQLDPDDQTYLASYQLPGHRALYHVYLVNGEDISQTETVEKAHTTETDSLSQNGQ